MWESGEFLGWGDEGRRRREEEEARGLTRLVERDVPILADATEEELDAAVRLDLLLVLLALRDQILRVSVQDVHLRGRDVDCVASGGDRSQLE